MKINDIEIYYEIHGTGEPLVLISGLGYSMWQWHKMVPYLSQHFKVITFDNRGVGKSDKPAGPYTASMLAADTAGLLNGLGIAKAIIMGHSMGGFIAQAFALEFPERVSKLVLASTNFGGPHHIPVTAEAMAVLTDMKSDPVTRFKNGLIVSTAPGFAEKNPDMIQEWLSWRIANPLDMTGYQAQLQIGLALMPEAECFEHKLDQITAPALILFGTHDKVVPPANADLLNSRLRNSRIVILSDAGHFFPIEVPEMAAKAVIQFTTA